MSTGDQQPSASGASNPYQQPGYQAPNPYQEPTLAMGGADGQPTGGAKGNHKLKMGLAVAASVLMVAGTTYGGIYFTGDSDPAPVGAPEPMVEEDTDEPEDEEPTDEEPEDEDPILEDPGDSGDDEKPIDPRTPEQLNIDPVVDGWKTQIHEDRNIAWDAPEDWSFQKQGDILVWDVEVEGEETSQFTLSTTTIYLESFCGPGSSRAFTGTTGELGAVDSATAAENSAFQYVLSAYDNNQEGTLEEIDPEPFENEHGFTGHIAYASVEGVPLADDADEDCATTSGRTAVVSYVEPSSGDIFSWVAVIDTGVDDELDQDVLDQMIGSLRSLDVAAD